MFRTEKQQQASRDNGARSNGPTTREGKDRSSHNATKHGIFSDSILLQPENRDAWSRLSEDLVTRFRPADNVELAVIHDMAVTQWRKERALNIETAILDMEYQVLEAEEAPARVPADEFRRIAQAWCNAAGRHAALENLGRQIIRLGNYWMRLHKKLKELQADRKAAESEAHATPEPAATQAPPAPPSTKSRNEPGVIEIASFQHRPDASSRPADSTGPAISGESEPCTTR